MPLPSFINGKINLIIGVGSAIIILTIIFFIWKHFHDKEVEEQEEKTFGLSEFEKYIGKNRVNTLNEYYRKHPDTYNKVKTYQLKEIQVNGDQTAKIALAIYNAKGLIDDERAAQQAVNMIPALGDLDRIDVLFRKLYGNTYDVLTYLVSFMNPEQSAKVYEILSKKPEFTFRP